MVEVVVEELWLVKVSLKDVSLNESLAGNGEDRILWCCLGNETTYSSSHSSCGSRGYN